MEKAFHIDAKIMKRILTKTDKRSKQGWRDRAVLFLLSLGLRRGEICALNDVDFDCTGSLNVRTLKKGKPRKVKLTPEIVMAIQTYQETKNNKKPMQDPEALFHTLGKHGPHESRRLSPMAVNGLLAKVLKKAGVNGQRITPHSFRHSCATHMLRQGRDLKTVQTVLGHKSIATTSMYLHALDVDAAFEGLPWLKKGGAAA